jgi:hypothetical protein
MPPVAWGARVSLASASMSGVIRSMKVMSWAGVGCIEAARVGEDGEQVGVDQVGDEGGEIVVVADGRALDLLDGHDVVLVDDGHNPEVEQGEQGVPRVEVARAVAQVAAGEKRLSDDDVVPGEELVVGVHEVALADGGEDLAERDLLALLREAEAVLSSSDGAGADEDDLDAALPQPCDLPYQRGHHLQVQPVAAAGDQVRPHFGDDPAVCALAVRAGAASRRWRRPLVGALLGLSGCHSLRVYQGSGVCRGRAVSSSRWAPGLLE